MKLTKRTLFNSALIATSVMLFGCSDLVDDKQDQNSDFNSGIEQKEYSEEKVDSLFNEVIERVETMVDVDDVETAQALDFESLSNELGHYVDGGDMKANLAYIVSEMMSLNSSEKLGKLADSLDHFFAELYVEEDVIVSTGTSDPQITITRNAEVVNTREAEDRVRGIASQLFGKRAKNNMISRSYKEEGINGMATALLARSPEVILSRAETPTWPSFATVSYIQEIIDTEITPRLGKVIQALQRIETKSANESLVVTVDNESFEIDVADIYVLDASVRTLRSALNIFTAYEWDVYAPNTTDYTWINKLIDLEENSDYYDKYSIVNDTLVRSYETDNNELIEYTYDLLKYNMERPGFASLKQANHAVAYEDLKAVPQLLRNAITALENETDSQEDDVIKKINLQDLDAEMIDISQIMVDEGFSEAFASNFQSPRKFVDFVEKILTEPYRFNETFDVVDDMGEVVDQATIDLTVDISKFFTNPVEDFRELLPLHKFRNKSDIFVEDEHVYQYSDSWSSFSINEGDIVEIDESLIDFQSTDSWGTYVYLNESYPYKHVDNTPYFVPFDFTDESGKVISWDEMDIMLFENAEIPYFKDYTVNGIFPGMTRAKWNNLLQELYNL